MQSVFPRICAAASLLLLLACNNKTEEKKNSTGAAPSAPDTAAAKGADSSKAARKAPTINLFDTLSIKRTVLCMKDSASDMNRISLKLGMIYGEKLGKCLKDNKLTMTGAPMAWYRSQQPPYFFEAGIPVDKKPSKLPPGVFVKEIAAGNVLVARFFGPYDMMGMAYEAAAERMKAAGVKADGAPYEIYIGDPGVQKDAYKVQTDVVFPVKMPEKTQQP